MDTQGFSAHWIVRFPGGREVFSCDEHVGYVLRRHGGQFFVHAAIFPLTPGNGSLSHQPQLCAGCSRVAEQARASGG